MIRFALFLMLSGLLFSCEKKSNFYENVYVFNEPAVFHQAVPDSSGGIFVLLSGISEVGYPVDYWLMYVDKEGQRQYELEFPAWSDMSLVGDPEGACYLAGVDRGKKMGKVMRLQGNGRVLWKKEYQLDPDEIFLHLQPFAKEGVLLRADGIISADSVGFSSRQRVWGLDGAGEEIYRFTTDSLENFEAAGLFPRSDGGFLLQGTQTKIAGKERVVEKNTVYVLDEKGRISKNWKEDGEREGMFLPQGHLHPSGQFLLSMMEVSDTIQKDKLLLQLLDSKRLALQKEIRIPAEVFAPAALTSAADGGFYLLSGRGFSFAGASLDWLKLYKLDQNLNVSWISRYGAEKCMVPYAVSSFSNGDLMLASQYGDRRNAVILVRCDAAGKEVPAQKRFNLSKTASSVQN